MHFLISLIIIIGLFFWLTRNFKVNIHRHKNNEKRKHDNTVDITNDSLIACSKCGTYYNGHPNYCPNCGVSLKDD